MEDIRVKEAYRIANSPAGVVDHYTFTIGLAILADEVIRDIRTIFALFPKDAGSSGPRRILNSTFTDRYGKNKNTTHLRSRSHARHIRSFGNVVSVDIEKGSRLSQE